MKVLILFTTRYGSVEKCALQLQKLLQTDTDTVNLKTDSVPELEKYDLLILGASIYVGKLQKEMTEFITNNIDILLAKKIGLFVNCSDTSNKKYQQFRKAFTERLYDHAILKSIFGDEVNFEKYIWWEKIAMFLIKGVKKSYSNLDQKEINRFAEKINSLNSTF
jgi:menaquinone-dependent protoporphyrinogen oxidase